MGVLVGDDYISDFDGDRVDTLLSLVQTKVDTITSSDTNGLIGACSAARNGAAQAQQGAEQAMSTATNAATTATNAASSAQSAASTAASDTAEQIRTEMSGYVTAAESWAVGGTGTRTGEDTNNARYWALQAHQAASDTLIDTETQTEYVLGVTGGRLFLVEV